MKTVSLLVIGLILLSITVLAGESTTIRNLIVMIPDGTGAQHIALARAVAAARGKDLHLDRMLSLGSVTTHSADNAITDSAAAATAIATGFKANNNWVSIAPDGAPLETLLEVAQERGMRTGLIATVMLYDATPAAFAAHTTSRRDYELIASSLLDQDIEVLLGGGESLFRGEGLIERAVNAGYEVVRTAADLGSADGPLLLGLFAPEAMAYELDRDLTSEPSLAEMTAAALDRLESEEGFFLMVEGGMVDWAGHRNDAAGVAHDLAAFDEAVGVAIDFAERVGETLVAVVPDHETGGLGLPPEMSEAAGALFAAVTSSAEGMARLLDEGRRNLDDVISSSTPIIQLTNEERDRILGAQSGYDPSTGRFEPDATIAEIVSSRGGVSFSSTYHTSAPVPAFWYGEGAFSDTSEKDNTEIGQLLIDAIERIVPPVSPTRILHNGTVVTMVSEGDTYEAIAVAGERILALGTNVEILDLAGPETEFIDLDGAAVYPGFIDAHSHYLQQGPWHYGSREEAEREALRFGVTTMAEMFTTPEWLLKWLEEAHEGELRLRHRLYLIYNSSCGGVEGDWYLQYEPGPIAPNLEIGGVKIFVENSICGDRKPVVVFSQEILDEAYPEGVAQFGMNESSFTTDELASVIADADEAGFQVAIHSIGDRSTDVCLDAYEKVLGDGVNDLRHMILHNIYLRDNQIDRYASLGLVAAVEPLNPCYEAYDAELLGPQVYDYYTRWSDLIDQGIHVALDSDFAGYGWEYLNPMERLKNVVTGVQLYGFQGELVECQVSRVEKLSPWQGLRMMTAEAAYALHQDHDRGTLEPGKLADLVVLSESPLDANPERLTEIGVLMTVVGGHVEYNALVVDMSDGESVEGAEGLQETDLPKRAQQLEFDAASHVIDDFEDQDLVTFSGDDWTLGKWLEGQGQLRLGGDESGTYLSLSLENRGLVGAHLAFESLLDLSDYEGLYIIASAPRETGYVVELSNPAEGFLEDETRFASPQRLLEAGTSPTRIELPFDQWRTGDEDIAHCPSCDPWLDPRVVGSLAFYLGSQPGSELQVHEVGVYGRMEPPLVVDDFEDGDLLNSQGTSWASYEEGGGRLVSPLHVEQGRDDRYLSIECAGDGLVGVETELVDADASVFAEVYVVVSASVDLRIGVMLRSKDEQWPSGNRDTPAFLELRATDAPVTLAVPYSEFVVEEFRRPTCPECAIEFDPERVFYVGIETSGFSGELRIHEVGFRASEPSGVADLATPGVDGYAVILETYDRVDELVDPPEHINRDRIVDALTSLGWREENMYIVLDHDVTAEGVEGAFEWLKRRVTEEDLVLFFAAGHGSYMKRGAQLDDVAPPLWASLPTDRKLFIVDSCLAGEFTTSAMYGEFIAPEEIEDSGLVPTPGLSISACRYDELAWGGIEEEGLPIIGLVMTYYLVEALTDASLDANGDSYVSVEEAYVGVFNRTRAYMRDVVFQVPEHLAGAREYYPDLDPDDYPHPELIDGFLGELIFDLRYYWEATEDRPPSRETSLVEGPAPIVSGTWPRKGPYLLYGGDPETMSVLWQLDEEDVCTLSWGETFGEWQGEVACATETSDHRYSVELKELEPNTLYHYRVTYGDSFFGSTFRSAPDPSATELRFIGWADSQYSETHTRPNGVEIPSCLEETSSETLRLLAGDSSLQTMMALAGDWMYHDSPEESWESFFDVAPVRELLTMIPIQGCTGNHDVIAYEQSLYEEAGSTAYDLLLPDPYLKYWPYPYEDDHFWSFDYGPIHFVVLDQFSAEERSTPLELLTDQYVWLENDLASNAKPWTIALFHMPILDREAYGEPGMLWPYADRMRSLMEAGGVDLYLTGHWHNHTYMETPIPQLVMGSASDGQRGCMYYTFDIKGNEMTITAYEVGGTIREVIEIGNR